MTSPRIGMVFPRELPAGAVIEFARRLDRSAVEELWVIEDCFFTAGVSLAAAAAAVTERLRIGIGIMPAPLRNPVLTAMELATLAGLAPSRITGGIGHGVQTWMGQVGARPASPVTTLREVIDTVRRLLRGETVTFHGSHVHLDEVALDVSPDPVPPVLAGVRQARSLAVAGEVADGVLLAEAAGPSAIRTTWPLTGRSPDDPEFEIAVFAALCVTPDRSDAFRIMAPWLAPLVTARVPALTQLDLADDLFARHAEHGVDGLATMPAAWWAEIGPIGTIDDAAAFLAAAGDAGARRVLLFPAPELDIARSQIDDVVTLTAVR